MNWILSLIVIVLISPVHRVAAADDSVIGFYEQRDLELIGSPNQVNAEDRRHSGFVSTVDRTILPHGRKALEGLITHPIVQVEQLQLRQKMISDLVTHAEVSNYIATTLSSIKIELKGLEVLKDLDNDKVAQQFFKKFYFQWASFKKFNNNSTALDFKQLWSTIWGPGGPLVEFFIVHKLLGGCGHGHGHGHSHGCCGADRVSRNLFEKVVDGLQYVADLRGRAGDAVSFVRYATDLRGRAGDAATYVSNPLNDINLAVHAIWAYEGIEIVQQQLSALNVAYKALGSLRRIIQHVEALQSCIDHGENHLGLFKSDGTDALCSDDLKRSLSELTKQLKSGYFADNASLSWYSLAGKTLITYKLYEQKRPIIDELLNRVGKLDAFMSMATVVKELHGKNNALCFVDFTQSLYDVKGLWNPMLSADNAVANDLHFDESSPSHIVLTGPNKAGKSSLLKAMAITSVLTQVFGVAPAKSASMPIFSKIITFMTVLDDISNDQSSLVARILRADNVTQTIKKLTPDQKALVLLDDSVGQGTTAVRGLQAATELFTTVGASANTIMIGATHYTELSNLADTMPTAFANWRIRINADAEGTKASSFTLEPGVCPAESVFDLVEAQGYFSEQKVS